MLGFRFNGDLCGFLRRDADVIPGFTRRTVGMVFPGVWGLGV